MEVSLKKKLEEKALSNSFYEVNISLIRKSDEDITRKLHINIDIDKKILVNQSNNI